MLRKSIIAIAACAILSLLDNAECLEVIHVGEIVSCWPYPIVPENFKVNFYFSTRTKKNVQSNAKTVVGTNLNFDPNRRTAVLIHGYLGNGQDESMNALRDALLSWEDMNVIAFDYRNGSSSLVYPQAAANTAKAATALKSFIVRLTKLINKPFAEWKPIHLIGYSLGAHVAGQVGALLKGKHNMTIDRITGLDAAEPCFDDRRSHLRLKKSDARFVDVIHTDAARRKSERFALRDALGHADFYVNGGSKQPGCPPSFYNDEIKTPIEKIDASPPNTLEETLKHSNDILIHVFNAGLCHHTRSLEVFIQSIVRAKAKACKLWAHPWSLNATKEETSRIRKEKCGEHNCIEMGINAEKYRDRPPASYYVKTTATAPYCVKQN